MANLKLVDAVRALPDGGISVVTNGHCEAKPELPARVFDYYRRNVNLREIRLAEAGAA